MVAFEADGLEAEDQAGESFDLAQGGIGVQSQFEEAFLQAGLDHGHVGDLAGELGHVAGLVGIRLLFLQFLDLDVIHVVVAEGGVVDFEAQTLRAGGVYFVEGLGVGEFFEPELDLVLVDG